MSGAGVGRFKPGDRVGVPWFGWTCGACDYCRAGRENLCDQARFQGRQVYAVTRRADLEAQRFALSLGAVWAEDSVFAGRAGQATVWTRSYPGESPMLI